MLSRKPPETCSVALSATCKLPALLTPENADVPVTFTEPPEFATDPPTIALPTMFNVPPVTNTCAPGVCVTVIPLIWSVPKDARITPELDLFWLKSCNVVAATSASISPALLIPA